MAVPKECKRLAEVDFPISDVSRNASEEKEARAGHVPKIHIWPAARPTASSRAVLLALLLPDPCDPLCPDHFKLMARRSLPELVGTFADDDMALRRALLSFIAAFSDWDAVTKSKYVDAARELVHAAHSDEIPLVVDPFSGGGSIPLEALRLGCDAFATDLNPVAGLILRVVLQDIPRHGAQLTEELQRIGADVKQSAEREVGEFYPPDPDGAKPIAYLWARTVRCESPNCGAEIPLLRSFWIVKKGKRRRAFRAHVVRRRNERPFVDFDISEPSSERNIPPGTVRRASATCLCCSTVLPPDRVRAQMREQRGGADVIFSPEGTRVGGARLLGVVTLRDGVPGRQYRPATERDYQAVRNAKQRLDTVAAASRPDGLSTVPDEPLPPQGTLGFRVQLYGMSRWSDLFTVR